MTSLVGQASRCLAAVLPPQTVVDQHAEGSERIRIRYRARDGVTSTLVDLRLRPLPTDSTSLVDDSPEVVWVTPSLSPALRLSFRAQGRSFISVRGREVVILHPALVIDRIAPKRVEVRPSIAVDPFRPGAARVVFALLNDALDHGPRTWGIRELAACSGVDRTTTSHVVQALADEHLVTRAKDPHKRGRGLAVQVPNPRGLLERWSAVYDVSRNAAVALHAPMGDRQRFLHRLPRLLGDYTWALTVQAGASVLAPHAAWERVHLYVDVADDDSLADIAYQQDWEPGDTGALVLMRPWYHQDFVRRIRLIDRLPVVDSAQLLLDLWRYPVRGREQAEHLLGALARSPASPEE